MCLQQGTAPQLLRCSCLTVLAGLAEAAGSALAVLLATVAAVGVVCILAPSLGVALLAPVLLGRGFFCAFGVTLTLESVGVKDRSLPLRAGDEVLAR